LKLLANNIQGTREEIQFQFKQKGMSLVYNFIDKLYNISSLGYEYSDIHSYCEQYGSAFFDTAHMAWQIRQSHRQILECWSILRKVSIDNFKEAPLKEQLVPLFGISPTFGYGHKLHQLAAKASFKDLQELQSLGYQIFNSAAPAFAAKSSSTIIADTYPFKIESIHYSYALKYALLYQADNNELIEGLMNNLDLARMRPFLLEILIYIGKILTPKHWMFQKLFIEERGYLLGKLITVDTILKNFGESVLPIFAKLYYTKETFEEMMVNLLEILIENNEQ